MLTALKAGYIRKITVLIVSNLHIILSYRFSSTSSSGASEVHQSTPGDANVHLSASRHFIINPGQGHSFPCCRKYGIFFEVAGTLGCEVLPSQKGPAWSPHIPASSYRPLPVTP